MDVNNANLDNNITVKLTLVSLKFPSQDVHATNNITNRPTDVTIAHKVNSQETLILSKTEDAKFSNKTVTEMVKFNLTNNNAMDVHHAQLDKISTLKLTAASNQSKDHNAHATNNMTKLPTNAETAQLVNSQVTQTSAKTVFAEWSNKTVMPVDKSN
jgi:predicted nuclease of predicted toxin-antitoxin system